MRTTRIILPLALALLSLAACGKGDFFASVTPPPDLTVTNLPDPTLTFYHAYGDSITAGYGVTNSALDYVSLVGTYNNLPTVDFGIGGEQACDLAPHQLPLQSTPQLTGVRGLNTLLIGTNDVDLPGTGLPEANFNLCQQAAIAWLAVPEPSRLRATDSSITTTGAAHLTTAPWNSIVTDALGATSTFRLTTPALGPIYIWYQIIDGNSGTFNCTLDGNPIRSLTTAAPTTIHTFNNSTNSMALLRIPAVPAGVHTLTFTQTSTAPYGSGIIAVGSPATTPFAQLPRLLVGTVPPQLYAQHATAVAAYNADIRANVALLQSDGLNLTLFFPADYMSGTTTDLADTVHPNALGHREIFKSIEVALGP